MDRRPKKQRYKTATTADKDTHDERAALIDLDHLLSSIFHASMCRALVRAVVWSRINWLMQTTEANLTIETNLWVSMDMGSFYVSFECKHCCEQSCWNIVFHFWMAAEIVFFYDYYYFSYFSFLIFVAHTHTFDNFFHSLSAGSLRCAVYLNTQPVELPYMRNNYFL